MDLKEMLTNYEGLLTKKDELAEATKANNAAIKEAKSKIADQMIDDDTPQITVGDRSYSLQEVTRYSKKGDDTLAAEGLNFFEELRNLGRGDLIKETVNAQSLQAAMKEEAENNDGELPEGFARIVTVFDDYDIHRTKARNKALKKAKGE